MTEILEGTLAHGASEAANIIEVAREAEGAKLTPKVIDPEQLYVISPGDLEVLDLAEYRDEPRRKRGGVTFYASPSFADYVNRHNTGEGTATLWADVERSSIRAVLNDHTGGTPGWKDHTAALTLRHPPAWKRWTDADGKLLSQEQFAELIEASLPELVEPDGATMLELAQSFHATKAVAFRSDRRLASGQVQLTYEEQIEAKAGERGELTIPQTFVLALAPYEGTDPYRVPARLRYRIGDGKLGIGFLLERPEEVLRAAFDDIIEHVESETGLTTWRGTP